jgi:hypothetical protein
VATGRMAIRARPTAELGTLTPKPACISRRMAYAAAAFVRIRSLPRSAQSVVQHGRLVVTTWDEHLAASRARRDTGTPRPAPVPELVTSHGTRAASDPPGVPAHMQSRWQMVGSGKDPERGRYLVYIDRQDASAKPPF